MKMLTKSHCYFLGQRSFALIYSPHNNKPSKKEKELKINYLQVKICAN